MNKILIANRGEIAVRVARGCHNCGITAVAVYSDPDRTAFHVRVSDEAYPLDGITSAETYLVQEKIIEIAKSCKADAIHPGYGFLAENAGFARLCAKNNIIFIGPSPEVIKLLGDKLEARVAAIKAGLPLAPASTQDIEDIPKAKIEAGNIGYPVLIKAAAGGGGKGMRIVNDEDSFEAALKMAASEAKSAFGDGRVYIEKYIARPRHIEIQIMADTHGNVVHLGERECSIQRRHQKVIEESPSAVVTQDLRKRMGDAAISIARATGYVGAGTVEFLVDEDLNFYFLEVNTRLQVEHPVTEMVTGFDLVKEQIRVARGHKLSFTQEDVVQRGHAIECRIYAEDAAAGFVPCTGKLAAYQEPAGPGVRIDSGFLAGDTIPVYYDPLIAKLVTTGRTRETAIKRMIRALNEYIVHGVDTTIPFNLLVMENESFVSGILSTHFIEDEFPELADSLSHSEEELEISAMAAAIIDYKQHSKITATANKRAETGSPWKLSGRVSGLRKVW
ncbi:MAG: acetyl-CoA carboxylase biotin carboxylase subunit [candidate division Zixibacteria bacterium]|nr:acetyl-CoA carboxylase biotin carboxylase subunit [candidate division Zixibacteria bacterium]